MCVVVVVAVGGQIWEVTRQSTINKGKAVKQI